VDGSRILVLDENGLEVSFEDLVMLFISYGERIIKSKGNTVILTPSIAQTVADFIEDSGYHIKKFENYPGEISRQIREHRACFAAADTLKFYFPQYSPYSDGNYILLKLLEIMTNQNDLLSSLTRGFPKGIKVNKTIPLLPEVIQKFHNELRQAIEANGYKYHDIINELKVIDDEHQVSTTIKLSLYRNAALLSADSENVNAARDMLKELESIMLDLN
jgi:phosphomannomutase